LSSPDASASPDATVEPSPSPTLPPEPGLHVDHVWVDLIDRQTGVAVPVVADAPMVGVERGRLYVVRYQVVNDSDEPIELLPVIEFADDPSSETWTAVPSVDPVPGVAFYTSANVRRGEEPGTAAIEVPHLRLAVSAPAVVPTPTPTASTPCEPTGSALPSATPGLDAAASADLSTEPAPNATADPASAVPASADPASPDPASPDPASPDPASPDPASPDPASPDPAMPDPASPDPAMPDPASPDPAMPDPASPSAGPVEPSPCVFDPLDPAGCSAPGSTAPDATPAAATPTPEPSLAAGAGAHGISLPGIAHVGVNPGPAIILAGHGFTEVSFTVRATADAAWLASYAFRLANGDDAVPGDGVAILTLRDRPPVDLSPGQQEGLAVDNPLPLYPLYAPWAPFAPVTSDRIDGAAGEMATGDAALPAPGLFGPSFVTPHDSSSLTSDTCARCHASHTAQSRMLLVSPEPLSAMCLACHDGSGAATNIAAQYADPTIPANDAITGSYYSHPATAPSNHVRATNSGEFEGVLDRHSACTDCHGPHLADGTPASETAFGWTASGALIGASGVAVQNGPAGTAPTYTWTRSSTYEYQLCFKCHSGFTQLNPQTGGPSTWALDKAVELNPANLSYHPVEAPGTNTTTQMGRSLSGTSPYKLWTFTTGSTIRCVSCHGDARLADPVSPPAPGARLAPHTVANRGMLIQPLRDRLLKGSSDAYDAADFALCYACHAEAPFVDTSQDPRLDTRFPLHGTHTAAIASFSGPPGGTVDDDGAGLGNALCAECHFRTHGTAFAVDGQVPNSRLVNFAPNARPYQGVDPLYQGKLEWNAVNNSCTLTCHGVNHRGWSY
jgi:predicted CXXCH cytochrome family protein